MKWLCRIGLHTWDRYNRPWNRQGVIFKVCRLCSHRAIDYLQTLRMEDNYAFQKMISKKKHVNIAFPHGEETWTTYE